MDAFYILQASLMTRYINEPTNPYMMAIVFIYLLYKATPTYSRIYKRHIRVLFDK